MTIATLLSVLNAAIKDNALSLTDDIEGLSWQSDLKSALSTNLNLSSLSISAATLSAAQAATNSVVNTESADMPSVLLFGTPDSDILNVPKDRIQLSVYFTPVNLTDDTDKEVYFTLIAQIMPEDGGATGWTPADSYPVLASSSVFSALVATKPPSFILTAFDHDQQWNYGGPGTGFSNTFKGVKLGLNLQVPSGLSTSLFPALEALFGDLSLFTFDFNGWIDNSQTATDPKNLHLELLADLGDNYNKTLSGNSDFKVEFDAGFQAIPAQTDPNPPDTATASVLITQVVLQATIGHALIQAIVPIQGDNTLSFSMSGLDDAPALSLADIADLFASDFLTGHLPQSLQQNTGPDSFLSNIGILNLGLTLQMPESGTSENNAVLEAGTGSIPTIQSILLEVGYLKTGPPIGYQPWFDLQDFSVTWSVVNPFPVATAEPTISIDGDFELLEGDISFEASFSKQAKPADGGGGTNTLLLAETTPDDPPPATEWVFEIEGGLEEGSKIQLSDLFTKFSSHSDDLPVISIDELSFSAKPEESVYSGSFELDFEWNFKGYTAPTLKGFGLDITKNKEDITGSITAKIAVGDTAVFDFKAERTETEWAFSAQNEEDFSIGDLAKAFDFKYPASLDSIVIKTVSVKYTAPIKKEGGTGVTLAVEPENPAEETPASTFSIAIEATFPIATEQFDVSLTYTKDATKVIFDGTLIISPKDNPEYQLEFKIDVDSTASNGSGTEPGTKDTTLVATLKNPTDKPLNISDFANALGVKPPPLHDVFNDIELVSAQLEYDTGTAGKGFLFTAVSAKYGQLVFAIVKSTDANATWKPFVALAFTPKINFDKLPVIGSYIKKIGPIDLEQIQIAGVPIKMEKADVDELKLLFKNASPEVPDTLIPNIENDTLPQEAIFNAVLNLNGETKPINLVFKSSGVSSGSGAASDSAAPVPSAAGDDPGDDAKLPVNNSQQGINKTFGPVHISKFNLAYTDGKLSMDINGELTLAGIALSFQGMGIKMKFPPKDISDVSFQLHGLGVNVNKGSLRIAGGFITLDDNFDNFMGMLAITAGSIGMQAFGGYATTTPQPSFFIFVNVEVPIGGPPFFFVDGLSGGFGLNRRFIMPNFEELPTFPLLPGLANNPIPPGAPASIDDVTTVLTKLAKFIPPKANAYWIAAGLGFTSFEIIQVNALLEVSFGTGFQLGLLGSAALSIPEPEEPIAYIQLVFEVDFDSEQGFLGIFAEITPASFVFSSSCHLMGGFAFYTWYKGEHEGDFLVSIGGYHPAFVKPAWYPAVPRLGMNWDMGILKISGQSYFALTPHMLMAGLEMKAVFDISIVKATFDAGFDFLLGWKPFFYLADAYIHLSVELHLLFTIHFQVGVDLNIWGPEFGGVAKVDLSIFSFSIHFGSKAPTPPPIPWAAFKQMLPNSRAQSTDDQSAPQQNAMLFADAAADSPDAFSVSQVVLSNGLIQQLDLNPLEQTDINIEKTLNWIIDPNTFQFLISAGVPSNNFYFNNESDDPGNINQPIVNARAQNNPLQLKLTPATGLGNYVNPSDEAKFYTNQNLDPSEATIFAYDQPAKETDYWWKQTIQVGPSAIPPGVFNDDGTRKSGFASTFIVNVFSLDEDEHGNIQLSPENNFVVTLVSKNSAKSLWGDNLTAGNAGSKLNDQPPTIKNTLFGITLSPKLWNPLQTREINIYKLLFQTNNNLNWPTDPGPSVPANTYAETILDNGDTMQFKASGGQTIQSKYRQLDQGVFSNINMGQQLIETM